MIELTRSFEYTVMKTEVATYESVDIELIFF